MPSWRMAEDEAEEEACVEVSMARCYRRAGRPDQRCIKPLLLAMDINMPSPRPSVTMAVPP